MAERTYVASYWFAGSRYCTKVVASSWAEAEAKLGAMALGQIDGEWVADIPAVPAAGLLARAVCFVRNLFQ